MAGVFLSLKLRIVHLNPRDLSRFATRLIAPASIGVTLGILISSLVNESSLITFAIYSLSKSLTEVLLLVFSSTVFTMTAQYKFGPSLSLSLGMLPATTTEYGGIFP